MPPKTPQTPAKRSSKQPLSGRAVVRLRYDESEATPAGEPPSARDVSHLVPQKHVGPLKGGQDLVFMVIDVVEEDDGTRFQVWGATSEGASVLLSLTDFEPYFYMAMPHRLQDSKGSDTLPWSAQPAELKELKDLLNRSIPPVSIVQHIDAVHRRPILYYRLDCPDGNTYLRLRLAPGGNARQAGNAVLRAITSGNLKRHGLVWRDQTLFEYEVSSLQRFLADVPLSGGAWLSVRAVNSSDDISKVGYCMVPAERRTSTCDIEVTSSWRSMTCLSPDATQLADPEWSPFSGRASQRESEPAQPSPAVAMGAEAALRGDIAPLRILVMDVCMGTRDGKERTPVPETGDPVVAISCSLLRAPEETASAKLAFAEGVESDLNGDDHGGGDDDEMDIEEQEVHLAPELMVAAVAGGPISTGMGKGVNNSRGARAVAFILVAGGKPSDVVDPGTGAMVVQCTSEAELLLTWLEYFRGIDPDVIALFQVKDTLEAMGQRFSALGLHKGALHISRYAGPHSTPLAVRRVTMYSAAWVRSQSRMSSTSNQETFKADIDGRAVVDVLRQALSSCNLASFSLVDLVQSLLGETMEVLGAHRLAALSGIGVRSDTKNTSVGFSGGDFKPNPLRVARYTLRRVAAVKGLLRRLATIPETIEMARATGLTLGQVMWNAQMIRTWSLLLRVGQREGVIIPARPETSPLTEHTFILHPVEAGTTGLYRQPVAILDFASLYPSIYRSYNLCYTTLLHPEDVDAFHAEDITVTPTGATFVKPTVRSGILPSILAALMSARATTRQQLKISTDPSQRAVLDSRQKALKVTANALYGFTGAQASPLQCVPLANSCLAYGAQSCRRAREVLEEAAKAGRLGPAGDGAKVIYGHTDSLFVVLPRALDVPSAIQAGRVAAEIVSKAFPDPMELKFERVCAPLILLHVNRYAGRAYERDEETSGPGELMVKGLKSMWRQTAPFLRTLLHGVLVRVLMRDDVSGAVKFVESEVRRLLSGRVSMHELVMTGGLWRVTGEQVERAAAEGPSPGGAGDKDTSPAGGEEVRGPHAALAVRLSQRDPGRTFVLGERLQYVLLGGHKLQEDAAEDPLEAARALKSPDLELYWRHKVQRPLGELCSTFLTPGQLQSLLHGQHTMVKVDLSGADAPPGPPGPASPSPGKGQKGKARQTGLLQFYRATPKCLACRRPLHNYKGPFEDAPGLCEACAAQEGVWAETYLSTIHEAAVQEAKRSSAYSACRSCDSSLLSQSVLCDNGECPVTYHRLSTDAALGSIGTALSRLDII